jgi:hypothetical protein
VVGVTGAEGPAAVSIAYGDGSSGTNPDAPHTYAAAGTYVASFAVTTSTQSARCSATVTVEAPAPPANQPPSLVAKTTPSAGYFLFDFDGDGRYDAGGSSGANCRKDWTYNVGTWKPEVCVHDRDAAGKPARPAAAHPPSSVR